MKYSFALAFVFAISYSSGQDMALNYIPESNLSKTGVDKTNSKFTWECSLSFGLNTANLFSSSYTLDSPTNDSHGYYNFYRFKYSSNVSPEFYGAFTPKLGRHLFFEIGIGYYRRTFKVKRTEESYTTAEFENVKSLITIKNCFEIPIGIGFDFKYLQVSAGLLFPVSTVSYSKTIYKNGTSQQGARSTTSFLDNITVSSSLKISSAFDIKKYRIGTYLSLDSFEATTYFHLGVQYYFLIHNANK